MAADAEPATPAAAHHYSDEDEVPSKVQKYWRSRYEIWSRYDDGVLMTDDVWFGVTAEPIAIQVAAKVAQAPASKNVLIDAFAGAGGNTIQFALSGRWAQIFAVEKDADVLACAKRNAEIYGVANKIWFIHGDVFEVLKKQLRSVLKKAVVFGSPPWGGPSYTDDEVFDLEEMQPYSITHLRKAFSKSSNLALYLPRNSDLRQLALHVPAEEKADLVHYTIDGYCKGLAVYFDDSTSTLRIRTGHMPHANHRHNLRVRGLAAEGITLESIDGGEVALVIRSDRRRRR